MLPVCRASSRTTLPMTCGPDGPTHSHGTPRGNPVAARHAQERRDERLLELVVAVGGGARPAAGAGRLADDEAVQLAVQARGMKSRTG